MRALGRGRAIRSASRAASVGPRATPIWVALALILAGQPVRADSVCHDGSWDEGEFCGRDAWLVTGDTEMNHDCRVDLLDVVLFVQDFLVGMGPALSGDFNDDGFATLADFVGFMVPSFGNAVSPCTPSGMLPDGCQGLLALSFSSDPNTIVSTLGGQAPGPGTLYVIVSGWTDAVVMDYAIVTSPNIAIVDHKVPLYPHWTQADATVFCDPDPQHSYRGTIAGPSSWPTGPLVWNSLDYTLLDTDPAWVALEPVPACRGSSAIRWAKSAANRSIPFAGLLNAGINGPPPPGGSSCTDARVPTLDGRVIWWLPVILVLAAAAFLRSRSQRAKLAPSGPS